MKSVMSKMVAVRNFASPARGWTSLQRLNDNTVASPSSHATLATPATARARVHPQRSVNHATGGSSPAIDEVSAAKASSTKNAVPTSMPPGMPTKIDGSTMNASCGPCAGFTSAANTSGKISRLDNSDARMIEPTTTAAERGSDSPWATWLPYAIMIAMPTPVA